MRIPGCCIRVETSAFGGAVSSRSAARVAVESGHTRSLAVGPS
jgi:hypothetical protein